MPDTAAHAREARSQYAAERAVDDPVRLRQAARIFRVALARGLVDRDGHLTDEAGSRDNAKKAS